MSSCERFRQTVQRGGRSASANRRTSFEGQFAPLPDSPGNPRVAGDGVAASNTYRADFPAQLHAAARVHLILMIRPCDRSKFGPCRSQVLASACPSRPVSGETRSAALRGCPVVWFNDAVSRLVAIGWPRLVARRPDVAVSRLVAGQRFFMKTGIPCFPSSVTIQILALHA